MLHRTARAGSCVAWLSYKALADAGWQKQRIAQAKGVTSSAVTARLTYADFPQSVLDAFFKNDNLRESYAAELAAISNFEELDAWLTRETAMLEIIHRVTQAIPTRARPLHKLFGHPNSFRSHTHAGAGIFTSVNFSDLTAK